ncbi:MAG: 50S ribosomal protein L24 [Bacteroidetes bacterium]|nr:MAG: 50S ribosomal protein L24 [Bacteroidota bacterium]
MRLKKGDIVQVLSGNDKGLSGRVLEVYPAKSKILVEGVNIRKKHMRPNPKNQQGGIVSKEMPIHYSNVLIIDSDKNPSRIGIKFEEKEGKQIPVRYAKTNDKNL